VHEILYHLPADAAVLDLGCQSGSFDAAAFTFRTVRVDVDPGAGSRAAAAFIQADAARLPFRARCFDAVICNHGLEHFLELKPALQEVGRVLKRDGALFVSVPDATTLHDRLYRWLHQGGGHVNLFDDAAGLARMLAWYSGLPHVATKTLHASFSFLNRANLYSPLPERSGWFCWRWQPVLALMNRVFRFLDRRLGTRFSIYGWCLYFGHVPEKVVLKPWTNVCIRCGQGHPSDWLEETGALRRKWLLFRGFPCPGCGAFNWYTPDE
jgi:SAM-dependent methyltransferase